MALSDYDEVIYEDNSTNRLRESLQLFQQTASHPTLAKTDFIVFLNKNGLLYIYLLCLNCCIA